MASHPKSGENFQDWNNVVFRKTSAQMKAEGKTNARTTKERKYGGDNKNTQVPQNARKLDEETENFAHAKVSQDLKMKIQQARLAKSMTQKALATQCNLQSSVVSDYESGRAIPDGQTLNKLSRVLGVPLSNKKKSKKSTK